MNHLSYSETLAKYHSQNPDSLRVGISLLLQNQNIKLIVLDDDPTGIQTVHDCLLLTNWKQENLAIALKNKAPFFLYSYQYSFNDCN